MIRWLLILALIAGCVIAGDWLLDHPGELQLTWLGLEIKLHIILIAAALLIFALFVALFAILFFRLLTWPARRRARKQQRTFKRGLEQLTRGVTALAMGNEDAAEEALKKALTMLPGEPLPQLLNAQLLQRQGKHGDAQLQFRALMGHSATAELATRRLIEQHITRREWSEATTLAEEARKAAPRDRWLILTLIDLYARAKNTVAMLALTEGWQWKSPLSKEERHRYAALAYYLNALGETNPRKKEQALRHTVGYAADFLPAVTEYAYAQLAQDAPRRARKWLLAAWKTKPVSPLIPAILDSIRNESPRTQLRLLKPFLRGEMGVAHHLLAARQAMMAQEFARARKSLEEALALEENKEVITLMADVERELRSEEAANGWLARAVDAPQGATWVCMGCGALHEAWHLHCDQCAAFDSLRYERPEARITSVELAPTPSLY